MKSCALPYRRTTGSRFGRHEFYFVMELCKGGSAGDLMARNGRKLPRSSQGQPYHDAGA